MWVDFKWHWWKQWLMFSGFLSWAPCFYMPPDMSFTTLPSASSLTCTRPRFFIPQFLPPNKKLVPEVVRAWELIATHVQFGPQPALSFLLFHMLYHFFILLPSFRPQTVNQVIWDCCHPGITRQQSSAVLSMWYETCKDGKGYAIKPQFFCVPIASTNKHETIFLFFCKNKSLKDFNNL